jgi:hypothetical protein
MFVGKARNPESFFTLVGSSLAHKHETRPEVTNRLIYYKAMLITNVSLFG